MSSAKEFETVGAMHECRASDPFSRCVHCGAMAEQLAKPCKAWLEVAQEQRAALAATGAAA